MRFGVTFSHPDLGNDPGFLKDFAQTVEEAGFDHLLAAEHVIGGHPDRLRGEKVHTYDVVYHEPFVLFGFLGAVTRHLELVTAILVLPQRQTVLVAKQAAELDLLTGGRLRLGVGVGRNWMEYEALNEDFSNRGARIEEQVEVLRRLWSEELVTYEGRWHHLDRMGLNPMPVQRPIPIWMGSFVGAGRGEGRCGASPGWPTAGSRRCRPATSWRAAARAVAGLRGRGRPRPGDARASSAASPCGVTTTRNAGSTWRLAYRDLGATHLRVITAGGGFTSPAGAPRRPPCGGSTAMADLSGAVTWRARGRAPALGAQAGHGRQGVEPDGDHAEAGGVAARRPATALAWMPGTTPWRWHAATTVASAPSNGSPGLSRRRRQAVGEREVGGPDVDGVDARAPRGCRRWTRPPGGSRSWGCRPRARWPTRRSRRRSGRWPPRGPKLPGAGGRVAARGDGPLGLLDAS